MDNKKKALAVVAGPYRFFQVLWLYTQFKEYEWSILLLPYGKDEYVVKNLYDKCQQLGIFREIYFSNIVGERSSFFQQMIMFFKMILYYLVGKKKKLMKKIISSQIMGRDFDVAFLGCEYSIIEGAFIGLADEKEIYIFEEGVSDYITRKKTPSMNMKEIMSYLVAKMGYFSPYWTFEISNISLCTKYAMAPSLLKHRPYKEVRKLFEKNIFFDNMIKKVYQVNREDIKKYDAILFTTVMEDTIPRRKQYIKDVCKWIDEKYNGKKILIKKHPRDKEEYVFKCAIGENWDANLPGEVFCELLDKQDILIMEISTVILSFVEKNNNLKIFRNKQREGSYKEQYERIITLLNISEDKYVFI